MNNTQMTTTFQTNLTDTSYNGFSNFATWNVALWIQNDEGLYNEAKQCENYQQLVTLLYDCGSKETPDGVKWNDENLNICELNEMMEDL
jgi:hypothetical protein